MGGENYIEAVADQYHISYEGLKKRVNDLGNRGVTAPGLLKRRPSRAPTGSRLESGEKETGADVSQKLLLTWLIEVPALYGQLKDYLSGGFHRGSVQHHCADAVCTAGKGELNPPGSSAALKIRRIRIKGGVPCSMPGSKGWRQRKNRRRRCRRPFCKVKKYSLDERARQLDVTDMEGFQKLILERSNLQKLENCIFRSIKDKL